jgi:hypothetical protein
MRTFLLLCLGFGLVLTGCGDKSGSTSSGTNTTSTSSGNPLDAPGDYLKAAAKGQQNAVKVVDTTSLNQAIQLFNVDKGRNPKDLNELVEHKFIPKIPEVPYGHKLVYDASAGKVSVVKQ